MVFVDAEIDHRRAVVAPQAFADVAGRLLARHRRQPQRADQRHRDLAVRPHRMLAAEFRPVPDAERDLVALAQMVDRIGLGLECSEGGLVLEAHTIAFLGLLEGVDILRRIGDAGPGTAGEQQEGSDQQRAGGAMHHVFFHFGNALINRSSRPRTRNRSSSSSNFQVSTVHAAL
jgi:hypothetical protein